MGRRRLAVAHVGGRAADADMTGPPADPTPALVNTVTYREAVPERLAGQLPVPLVVRTANGGGLGCGAQHWQATENWPLTMPGLKIAAPSNPADVVGLMASAIRSEDPVVFFEHKGLFASKGPAAPDGHVVPLGQAAIARSGSDITIVGLAATVPMALAAADRLAGEGASAGARTGGVLNPPGGPPLPTNGARPLKFGCDSFKDFLGNSACRTDGLRAS